MFNYIPIMRNINTAKCWQNSLQQNFRAIPNASIKVWLSPLKIIKNISPSKRMSQDAVSPYATQKPRLFSHSFRNLGPQTLQGRCNLKAHNYSISFSLENTNCLAIFSTSTLLQVDYDSLESPGARTCALTSICFLRVLSF